MTHNQLTRENLHTALHALGIFPGDVLFVHSDLRTLGLPVAIAQPEQLLSFYFDAITDYLGMHGTLAVPAYFYEYARYGIPFDVNNSPISLSLGAFSSYVIKQPGVVRSCNPLQSIAAVGANAEMLCGSNSLSGYGTTSPWHKINHLNGKFLFLGVTLQTMTFVHYIEQQYGVPHLYFKVFTQPVIKDGKTLLGSPVSAVRYLEYSIEYDISKFESFLRKEKLLHTIELGKGKLTCLSAQDAYQTGIACLESDPYFFLKQPPQFIQGKIPMDGPTGEIKNE